LAAGGGTVRLDRVRITVTRQLDELPGSPASHFRLRAYDAVRSLRARLPAPDDGNGLGFLTGYYRELDAAGFTESGPAEDQRWSRYLAAWEGRVDGHLPVRALSRAFELTPLALTLLFTAGLVDEDARFGTLFEALSGLPGEPRPTTGLLATWSDDDDAREAVAQLLASGLLEAANADAPRSRWTLHVPAVLWEALRGAARPSLGPWASYRPVSELPELDELVLPAALAEMLDRVPELVAGPDSRPLVVRGPNRGGRRTLAAAVARRLGLGLLELRDPAADAGLVGALAALLPALPLVVLDPAPGETVELPQFPGYRGPLAAVAGRRGGLHADRAVTITLPMPSSELRATHWEQALGDRALAAELAGLTRLTGGTIRAVAERARAEAALAGRDRPGRAEIATALGAVDGEALETLATRIRVTGDWGQLAVGPETGRELDLLRSRCRYRERLHEHVGPVLGEQLTAGVRVLFSGPSGTGKTLAARLLAASLGKQLYALDLSAVVNKYLGETEKNLDAVLSRAEELDVVLVLDEGDALMTARTDVTTANDRYANLETNFLLQRLESYEGILIVTTNAGDRIDPAFRRRLDVVIEFRMPDASERRSIWELHLPGDAVVGDPFLAEIATRCQLSGGQIRNAVLHASVLALHEGSAVGGGQLDRAVRREYRKSGSVCPLRAPAGAGAYG
jgi:ATPase family associated with various cellular activities (AAA)